jgi:hypothetical protein
LFIRYQIIHRNDVFWAATLCSTGGYIYIYIYLLKKYAASAFSQAVKQVAMNLAPQIHWIREEGGTRFRPVEAEFLCL